MALLLSSEESWTVEMDSRLEAYHGGDRVDLRCRPGGKSTMRRRSARLSPAAGPRVRHCYVRSQCIKEKTK
jgi:hypothetical protein